MTFFVWTAAAQDYIEPVVSAEILNISADIGYITFYDAEENKHNGKVGMTIPLQSTIVTEERQRMECVIMRNNEPIVGFILSEVTDFYYDYDSEHDVFYIELHYGRVRIVSNNKIRIETESEHGRVQTMGGDFGIISFIKDDGTVYEGIYDFDGKLSCESKVKSTENTTECWDRFDAFVGEKAMFSEQELLWWQDTMLFDLTRLPEEIPYVLENLLYPQRQDVLIANYSNLTTEEKQELAKIVLGGIFRFDGGYFFDGQNQGHGVWVGWSPGGIFMNRRLEFRLDLSVGFCLTSSINNGIEHLIHRVNDGNNPWSFGSDQGGAADRIVFDLFDDLLMKLGLFRYGFDKPTETAFVQIGSYYDVSDKWHYSFFGFNPQGLTLSFRHNSFVTKINTRCFETFIYAEDIVPRGLYGLSMKFMTPAKSIRWKLGFSAFIDTYDLLKFGENEESFFPTQVSANLELTLFDLPSFGFDLYLNGGINIPFSYNFVSGTSYFNSRSGSNAAALFANLSADLGMVVRFKHFAFIPEFIADTVINRVGQFDMSYSAKRHLKKTELKDWYDYKSSNQLGISDFFFGGRFKMRFDDYEYVKFELAYQASVAYSQAW
ncbi:MAG: hypothetical protein J6W76_07570, partial [Spirochaetales bacterium]|nr:hypothetical protein [Spirochaetales bacterium]